MAAVTGEHGKARARRGGCIALAHIDATGEITMRCARVGDGFLKPDTWYVLDSEGEFAEASHD